MERLKEFLDWHCENPHNVNFKMIVAKEDREETLNGMYVMSKLLDTGLTPHEIMELKERDAAVKPISSDRCNMCRNCCDRLMPIDRFCPNCGQRLKWEED